MSLTRIQSSYLEKIAQLSEGGVSPTYSEIAAAMGKKSKGAVAAMVRSLEAAGGLRRLPHRHCALEVISTHPEPAPHVYLEGDNFNLIGGPKVRESFLAWYCAAYPGEVQ